MRVLLEFGLNLIIFAYCFLSLLRVLLECGSYSRAGLFRGFTVFKKEKIWGGSRPIQVTSWKEFPLALKKWYFGFFCRAKASTFKMSMTNVTNAYLVIENCESKIAKDKKIEII